MGFKKQQKRKIVHSSSSEDSHSLELQDSSDDDNAKQTSSKEPENEAVCMFCDGNFSDDHRGQIWVQCILCHSWAHEDCSGAVNDHYVCDFCN